MSTLRHLRFSLMSFHLTNKCITDSLCRDWNDSTNTWMMMMNIQIRYIISFKVNKWNNMIRGVPCGMHDTQIQQIQQLEGALVVANPKEKAKEKTNAKAKEKTKANPKKPENALDVDALISDHTH